MLSLTDMLAKIRIGNDAGWALFFYKDAGETLVPLANLSMSRNDYYAEIDATLPAGLEAGTYTFTIEGMADETYGKLRDATKSPEQRCVVKLYLYWRDANVSTLGYLKNLASLVDTGSGPT